MKKCRWPVWIPDQKFHADCGKCLHCKRKRASEWSLRLIHEREASKGSVFVTLTYDNKHVPKGYTLEHRDVQLFFKKVRKTLSCSCKKYSHFRAGSFRINKANRVTIKLRECKCEKFLIKYFMCGEYGTKRSRPHYHLIIFGLTTKQFMDKMKIKTAISKNADGTRNWRCPVWADKEGDIIGHVTVGYDASDRAIAYCTGYILKKVGSKHYEGRKPPYLTCSHRLGYSYASNWHINRSLCIRLHGYNRALPRYYRKILGLTAFDYKPQIEEVEHATLVTASKQGVAVNLQSDKLVFTANNVKKNHREAMRYGGVVQPLAFWRWMQKNAEHHNKNLYERLLVQKRGTL